MAAFLKMYFCGVPVLAGWVYAFFFFFVAFPGEKPVPPGGFMICVFII